MARRFLIIFCLFCLCVITLCACSGQRKTSKTEEISMSYPYERPLNIAHRGARSVAPENTLLAARQAYEFDADMWELDAHLSADGELILLHDDSLKRTTNVREIFPDQKPWYLEAFTQAQLQDLDAGSWFLENDPFDEIKTGSLSQAEQDEISGTPLPSLREALQYTKDQGWTVNVELKDLSGKPGDAEIVGKTVALVEEMDMVDQVLISSFNLDYLLQVKALNASIHTGALVDQKVKDPIELLKELGADALNPEYKTLKDLSMITELREAGYDVYVWTVNDEEDMVRLINAGVSGIITDYPQILEKILDEYEQ